MDLVSPSGAPDQGTLAVVVPEPVGLSQAKWEGVPIKMLRSSPDLGNNQRLGPHTKCRSPI